jgi:hypothetical protein
VRIGDLSRPDSVTAVVLIPKVEDLAVPCRIWFSAVAIAFSAVAFAHFHGWSVTTSSARSWRWGPQSGLAEWSAIARCRVFQRGPNR